MNYALHLRMHEQNISYVDQFEFQCCQSIRFCSIRYFRFNCNAIFKLPQYNKSLSIKQILVSRGIQHCSFNSSPLEQSACYSRSQTVERCHSCPGLPHEPPSSPPSRESLRPQLPQRGRRTAWSRSPGRHWS